MFLGEDQHLVVEKTPVTGVLADSNDGNQHTGSGGEIRGLLEEAEMVSGASFEMVGNRSIAHLSSLLLQHQQLVDGTLSVGLKMKRGISFGFTLSSTSLSRSHLRQGLGVWDELVGILGEVLLGLQQTVRHDDECD